MKLLYRHRWKINRDKYRWFLKGLRYLLILWTNYNKQQNWKTSGKKNENSWTVYCECVIHYYILNCALDFCYFRQNGNTDNDTDWSLSCFYWKILQQIETLCQCPKCNFHQKWECLHHFFILTFFIVVFANTNVCLFCIIYVGLSWIFLSKVS